MTGSTLVRGRVDDAVGGCGGEYSARFIDRALVGAGLGEARFLDEPLEAGGRVEYQDFGRLERLEAVLQPGLGVQEVTGRERDRLAIDGEAQPAGDDIERLGLAAVPMLQ